MKTQNWPCSACNSSLYDNAPGAHHITCAKRGRLTPELVRSYFSTAGADIELHNDGVRVAPSSDNTFGRVQTLRADMRAVGFVARWLPGKRAFVAMRSGLASSSQ